MKAVILAGGQGSRLAPLSLGSCKPMTPLLGRPVLRHIVDLLREQGITHICMTLCHTPQGVMEYFGDGSDFGVSITYCMEETPLGTAGGVKACMEGVDEDFLVIGGDCVCDLDIRRAIRLHRERGGVATLALYPHKTPLEYGLVHLDTEGRITHFLEKPTWGQVMTNLVNTGIYVLSSEAMDRVPAGERYDFGKDLFPALLAEGLPLYGAVLEGYWCDMGDCASYLQCTFDALQGKVKLQWDAPQIAPGIWSQTAIPEGVTVIAPCYLGEHVALAPHCMVGPYGVVESGCEIGERGMVQRSVLLEGSQLAERATASGAIVCQRGRVGIGAILHRGAVVGEESRVERGATLMEGVAVWPGRCAPAGERLRQSLVGNQRHRPLTFGDGGVIRGTFQDMDSQSMLVLGSALADCGVLLLGCGGGDGAKIFAQALASGVGAAGGVVQFHELISPAQSSWLAQRRKCDRAVFIQQEGERCYLHLVGGDGLPLERGEQRKIEGFLRLGQPAQVAAKSMGKLVSLAVGERDYSRDIAQRAPLYSIPLHPVTVAVGEEPSLRRTLGAMGCTVLTGWRQGVPLFVTSHGGERLEARDENGAEVDSGQLLTLIALIEMEHGSGTIAVPPSATVGVELVAAGFGGTVLRLGRDGQVAREKYAALPWVRDGVFAAARIASRMAVTGESLGSMLKKIPRLTAQRREIPLAGGRGDVMEALAAESHQPCDGGEGIRVHSRGGWVYLAPLSRRAALQVVAEGLDMEVSSQLCDHYSTHAQAIDRRCCEQDSQENPKK